MFPIPLFDYPKVANTKRLMPLEKVLGLFVYLPVLPPPKHSLFFAGKHVLVQKWNLWAPGCVNLQRSRRLGTRAMASAPASMAQRASSGCSTPCTQKRALVKMFVQGKPCSKWFLVSKPCCSTFLFVGNLAAFVFGNWGTSLFEAVLRETPLFSW